MPPTLTTERLTLRPITQRDAPTLHRIYSHSRAMRYMPRPPHPDVGMTWNHLSTAMSREGAVYWAITVTAEGQRPVGVVNYLGGTLLPGLGYIVHPAYWKRGIATEAAHAALGYGFDSLGHDRIELWIDERNRASQRVAEKLNFRLRGRLTQRYDHTEEAHLMLVYGMWASEWQGQPPPGGLRTFSVTPVLPVRDLEAALAFYTELLGFRMAFRQGQVAGLLLGAWSGDGLSLHLAEVTQDLIPNAQLYIVVNGAIDELYERVAQAHIAAPLERKPWGMREFTLADPDGHHLRFAAHGD